MFLVASSVFVLWGCLHATLGLVDVGIHIPPAVVHGSKVTLKCLFDLEGDKLYSVKWYRGAREFYRYTASDPNPIKQFKIKGLHVVEDESNATQVVLKHVTKEISGQFNCEITADQPSFYTVVKSADLQVVELPKKEPHIIGIKSRYRPGEHLKANCTSERSDPPANLTWYVNGKLIEGFKVQRYRIKVDKDCYTSVSTLRMVISEQLFDYDNKLKVRCSSNLYHLYHRSSEKSISLERRRHRQHAHHTSTMPAPILDQEEEPASITDPPERNTLIFGIFDTSRSSSNIYRKNRFLSTYFLLIACYFVNYTR